MNVLKSVREERTGMNGNKTAKNELKVPEQNQLSAEREKAFKNGFKFATAKKRENKFCLFALSYWFWRTGSEQTFDKRQSKRLAKANA